MRTKTYRSWDAMKQRCLNPNDYQYHKYNHLGLQTEWHQFKSFLEDMGEAPPNTTLDRIDNSKGYFKGNVRWATATQQARNTKQTKFLEHAGISKPLGEWAEGLNISPKTLWARLQYMDVSRAVTQPKRGKA